MTKIYIVRHCEAFGNVAKLFQGVSDFDITESGAEQLKFLTKRFEDIDIDKVYTSPLIRTQKTARAVIGTKKLEPVIFDGLIEFNGGIIEGKPFIESCKKYPLLSDAWTNPPEDFAPENGDSMQGAYERIWNAVKNIASENEGKTVVCTSHGGVIRCLLCRVSYNDITKLRTVPFSGNTAVSLIEFDDNLKPNLIFANDISHIPQDYLDKMTPVITSVSEADK